jgi:hypothetical protein
VVLAAVVAAPVLLGPARVLVLRPVHGRVGGEARWRLAGLDLRVPLATVALPRRGDDAGVDDLSAHRQVALRAKVGVERVAQTLDHAGLGQRLAIRPQRRGVRHPVLDPRPEDAHERQPVAPLELHLPVGQVVERLHHRRLPAPPAP